MTEIWGPLVTFALATSVTPGPNNIMLTASGANFGFRRTIPHMLGVAIGFTVMVLAIGLGLSEVFKALPVIHQLLRYGGAAYLLYLAYRIATAAPTTPDGARAGRPLTFLQAALFQWVNPKGWMMAVGAISAYTTVGGDLVQESILIAGVFGAIGLPAVALWAGLGAAIGRLLQAKWALRAFNIAMALLLVASLVLIFV
ncbi:MAG TPA: LysE family translocator [Candidatus Angelobacter sp.]|nr:LysE family translocator [Candidatus Angelobacter sp.]